MFFLQTNGSGVLSFVSSGGKFESALFHVRDEKASGSHGGTSVAGSFQTRVLNTSLTNEISGASLSSNQITLPSGTYYINARMPFYNNIDYVKVKLRNITDSSDTIIGTGTYMYVADTSWSEQWIIGRFTISAQKTFELQYRCGTGINNTGLGHHTTYGTEVYSDCQIWKVA
jgi:hypothetical protein